MHGIYKQGNLPYLAKKSCPNCEQLLSLNEESCPNCGYNFTSKALVQPVIKIKKAEYVEQKEVITYQSAEPVAEVKAEIKQSEPKAEKCVFCDNCGAKIIGSQRYCGGCGARVSKRICPSCTQIVDANLIFCPLCGERLQENNTNITPVETPVSNQPQPINAQPINIFVNPTTGQATINEPAKEPETKQPEPAQPEQKTSTESAQPTIPDDVPHEIRSVYTRALRNMEALQFNQPEPEKKPESEPAPESEPDPLPLPSDFDISFTETPGFDNEPDEKVPVFTDINFDTTEDSSPDNNSISPEYTFDNSDVIAHLEKSGQKYTINNNVVITDKFSIITHSDTDFWVTDPENWFATGKTCPSPIAIVKATAQQNNTRPVIYLASTNIMDLESLIPQWESDGIIVITDINKL